MRQASTTVPADLNAQCLLDQVRDKNTVEATIASEVSRYTQTESRKSPLSYAAYADSSDR